MAATRQDPGRILRRLRLFPIAITLLVSPHALTGQAVSGEIVGRVEDGTGLAVVGVQVSVLALSTTTQRSTTTATSGRFRLSDLAVGTYDVRFERIGMRSLTVTGVVVCLGRTTPMGAVTLDLEAVELPGMVIEAAPILVDPSSSELSEDLQSVEYEGLPIGRDYETVIEILPQVNRSYLGDPVNVAGSTGLENAYFIEGVNVTDVYRGRTGTDLPHNFVEAVEVKKAAYQAEYGQAMGGLVNVVTRSGTPRFEWAAFAYLSGSSLSADAKPIPGTLSQRSFSDVDVGFSASGPLARDRLGYFLAYNPRLVRRELALPGLAPEESTFTQHRFAGKLDWRVSDRSDLYLSIFGDPTTERRVSPAPGVTLLNADPVLTHAREGGINASLRWVARIARGLRVEASLGHHTRSEDAHGATALGRSEPSFIDRSNLPAILLSGGNGTDQAIKSGRSSLKGSLSIERGGHDVKVGLEWQRSRLDVRNDENPGQVALLDDSVYRSSIFVQDFGVENRVLSAYVQDSWSVSERLHLNLGVRWDGQTLLDQDGAVGQSILDQFQPRLGMVFMAGNDGRSKIFAHMGRFYQQLALFWSTIGLAGFDQRQVFTSADPRGADVPVDSTLVISDPEDIRGGTEDLRGEHHDELVVGFEAQVSDRAVLGVRGIRRELRQSVTAAFRPDRDFAGGNPGRAELDHLPKSRRTYSAVEITLGARGPRFSGLMSYVYSESRGNYPGLFVAEAGGLRGGSFGPNNSQLTYFPAQAVNAEGPLPNDRPHVFKLSGSYEVTGQLLAGIIFQVGSGTPLSELGRVTAGFNAPLFLTSRGSEGRTPTTWDLSFRFAYRIPVVGGRLVLDLLNLGNPQAVVNIDQRRFNGARGSPFDSYDDLVANQRGERPGFGTPIAFQPPFQIRLGFEVGR
jgi:hypothetical protein